MELPKKSFYKTSGLAVACFFGSTLAGAYLAGENLKKLNRKDEVLKTYAFGFGILLFSLGVSYALDYLVGRSVPSSGLTAAQIVAFTFFYKALVPPEETEKLDADVYISNWKAFGVSLIFLIVILLIIGAMALAGLLPE